MSLSNRIIKAGTINVVPPGERRTASFARTDYRTKQRESFSKGESSQVQTEREADTMEDASPRLIDDAYNRGFEEGIKKGENGAKKTLSPALAALEKAACDLSNLKDTLWRQAEESMVDLAFAAAEKIIRREATLDGTIVKTLLEEVLSDFTEKEGALIRMNPDDYRSIKEWAPDFFGDLAKGANLKIEKDPRIERGGAVVETKAMVIDGRIEEQLQSLRESLAPWRAPGEL